MEKNQKPTWGTRLFVLLFWGLATLPVIFAEWPLEIAKWHLAAAANAQKANDTETAEDQLAKALALAPKIAETADFQYLQLQMIGNGSPQEVIEKLKSMAEKGGVDRGLGMLIANRLTEQEHLAEGLEAVKITFGKSGPRDATERNTLAYQRALAGVELEEALVDIDKALAEMPGDAALADTKAWVLHKLGRNKQAEPIINRAVEKVLELLPADLRDPPESYDPLGLNRDPLGTPPKEVDPEVLQSVAVLRYHRMVILQENGKEDAATADYRAIRFWGFEPSEKLH